MVVPTPDFHGRQEILALYLEKILHKDIDVPLLARGTTGFTGADLENMVNQAALRAGNKTFSDRFCQTVLQNGIFFSHFFSH